MHLKNGTGYKKNLNQRTLEQQVLHLKIFRPLFPAHIQQPKP